MLYDKKASQTAPVQSFRPENLIRSISAFLPIIAPAVNTPPIRYFVAEWTTISAPHFNGEQPIGVANVLSTMNLAYLLWANLAMNSKSTTSLLGF